MRARLGLQTKEQRDEGGEDSEERGRVSEANYFRTQLQPQRHLLDTSNRPSRIFSPVQTCREPSWCTLTTCSMHPYGKCQNWHRRRRATRRMGGETNCGTQAAGQAALVANKATLRFNALVMCGIANCTNSQKCEAPRCSIERYSLLRHNVPFRVSRHWPVFLHDKRVWRGL